MQSILQLKTKSADYFDSKSESEVHSKKTSINFNLFSRTLMEAKVSRLTFFPPLRCLKDDAQHLVLLFCFCFFLLETLQKLKKGGIYLSFILFNKSGELLTTNHQLLPSFLITKDDDRVGPLDSNSNDFLWIMKQSMDWESPSESGSSEFLGDADDTTVSHLLFSPPLSFCLFIMTNYSFFLFPRAMTCHFQHCQDFPGYLWRQ